MTGTPSELHVPVHPVRFVTAASLFDGHDAAINVMRRLLQAQGPDAAEAEEIRAWVLTNVRAMVQADILKEDQGQNTCIFSTEFALRCMADIQQWFIDHAVGNFYSVSISGYHIAEAGANPASQLAFTLANGFTYVVNTFLAPQQDDVEPKTVELARATEAEKQSQLDRLADFQARHADQSPDALARLQQIAMDGGNVFAELMNAVRVCSLGRISDAFFEVGGQYRRNV